MRLILRLLAILNIRQASADLARSERLYLEGDEAFAACERRIALAERLCQQGRARLAPR